MAHHIPKLTYGSGFVPTVLNFDYPPTEPDPEKRVANVKESTSLSGLMQTQLNHIEAIRKLKFRFLSEAKKTSLETFFDSWAAKGKAFRYYDDAGGVTYKTYTLDKKQLDLKMITPVGANVYIYEVELQFRRVADAAIKEGAMQTTITNNQSSAASIAGLAFDSTQYRAVQVFYDIWRKTNSSERVCSGWFKAFYKESTGNWTIEPGSVDGDVDADGDPAGVAFTVTTAGQVQYTSDNMAGTGYESEANFTNFTVLG